MVCVDELILHVGAIDVNMTGKSDRYSDGGIMYITIGEKAFPGLEWYDMVLCNLKRWVPDLISFGFNHTDSCVLTFMDGPCEIKLNRQGDGQIQVCCYRDHKLEIPNTVIDLSVFLKSVLRCIRKYERFLHENNLSPQFQDEQSMLRMIVHGDVSVIS